jgi:hypothetical protein
MISSTEDFCPEAKDEGDIIATAINPASIDLAEPHLNRFLLVIQLSFFKISYANNYI